MIRGRITKIEANLLSDGFNGMPKCFVTINEFDEFVYFGTYESISELLNEEVEFTIRKEIINGIERDVINEITRINKVQVVEGIVNSSTKLIDASNTDYVNTFDPNSILMGDLVRGRVAYLAGYSLGSSANSKWIILSCIDKLSKLHFVKLFKDLDEHKELLDECVGGYVVLDIEKNKYGLTALFFEKSDQKVIETPSQRLCTEYVKSIRDKQEFLIKMDEKHNLIETLSGIIYYLPGFHLTLMAMELKQIDLLEDTVAGINYNLLRQAVFASRLHLMPSNTKRSKSFMIYHRLITLQCKASEELIEIFDNMEEPSKNKQIFEQVQKHVELIHKMERGLTDD